MALPLLIGAAAAPIVGGITGKLLGMGDEADAKEQERLALAEYLGLDPSSIDFESLGPSAAEGVYADPQMEAYQRQALAAIAKDATTAGLTAEEKAALADSQNEAAQFSRGQREATMQDAAARGIGGSGFELAARLQADQGAAMRSNQSAMRAAAEAEARRRMAQGQLLSGAGQVRGQGFGEAMDRAQAHDAIARWNADTANRAKEWRYGQQAQLAQAKSGARQNAAAGLRGQAQQTAQTGLGIGQGVSQGFGAAAGYMDAEERRKKGY